MKCFYCKKEADYIVQGFSVCEECLRKEQKKEIKHEDYEIELGEV